MAVNQDVLDLIDALTARVDGAVEQVDRAVVEAWARAHSAVAAELEAAVHDLAASSTDGQWPPASKVRRAKKARDALEATGRAVTVALADMNVTVNTALSDLVPAAADWQTQTVRAQLPGTVDGAVLAATLDRVDPDQLDAIVTRTMGAITKDAALLPGFVTSHIQTALVRGVAVGQNPAAAAAQLVADLEGKFNLGMTRALVITRTEMLDAHRAAAAAQDAAMADVLQGWQWVTTLDVRTCIGCLVMHGTEHEVDEPGPLGHQQCRCARVPVLKPWTDLGFTGVEEEPSVLPDAQAWFDQLPPAGRERVAGKARVAAYDDGLVAWDDLVVRRSNPGWRDSYVPTPVSRLLR